MKNMKRSVRRHHYERLKNNWYHRLMNTWLLEYTDYDEEWFKERAAFMTRTACTCSSCMGCINPRKYEGITLQERRNLLSFSDFMKELN
jgi:hypothetical protein